MFDTHLCKCYQLSVMKSYQFLTFCFSLTLTVNVFAFICTALSNMRAIFLQNCLEGKSHGKNTQRANGHHNSRYGPQEKTLLSWNTCYRHSSSKFSIYGSAAAVTDLFEERFLSLLFLTCYELFEYHVLSCLFMFYLKTENKQPDSCNTCVWLLSVVLSNIEN